MLANPPFMTPKGGIRPHDRFRVSARRAEVLFVDYIASHLNEHGRAGIIVPEGIIFQSQNAYRQLRRFLLDESLVAVISLPGGVFNPYSGVKTSILILDKVLAPKTDHVAFFKVENDGYDLGAQRRPINHDDLPTVADEVKEYLGRVRADEPLDDFAPQAGLLVNKDRVADDGDYSLSGERYRISNLVATKWPLVQLGDCCDTILGGGTPSSLREDYWAGEIPWITSADIVDIKTAVPRKFITREAVDETATNLIPRGNIIVVTRVGLGKLFRNDFDVCISQDSQGLIVKEGIDVSYLAWVLRDKVQEFKQVSQGSTIQGVTKKQLAGLRIPLPPLEVQRELVAEIEGYQRVMDGARAVVNNWRPRVKVDPGWPVVPLQDACDIQRGKFSHRPRNEPRFYGGNYPFIQTGDVARADGGKIHYTQTLNDEGLAVSKLFEPPLVVITIAANIGETAVLDYPCCFPDSVIGLIPDGRTDAWFLELMMRTKKEYLTNIAPQAAQKNINIEILKTVEIPFPPLATQQAVVAEIEAERALVSANRELMERMEQRIQDTIVRVWEG